MRCSLSLLNIRLFAQKSRYSLLLKYFFTFALAPPILALHDVNIIANKTNAASVSIFFQIFHFKSSNDLLFLHLSTL